MGAYFQKMVDEGNKINQQNIGYAFGGPNSNTVATSLLQAAGLPQPQGNNLNGPEPAPGADMSFITGQYNAETGYLELGENALDRGGDGIESFIKRGSTDIVAHLRALAKQARAAARSEPVSDSMKLYNMLMAYGRNQQTRSYAPIPKIESRLGSADGSLRKAAGQEGSVPGWYQPFSRHLTAPPVHAPLDKSPAGRLSRNPARAPLPPGFAPLYKPQDMPPSNAAGSHKPAGSTIQNPQNSAHLYIRREDFGEIVEQTLNRLARTPPRGCTGFDPYLSPAWPGRKTPN